MLIGPAAFFFPFFESLILRLVDAADCPFIYCCCGSVSYTHLLTFTLHLDSGTIVSDVLVRIGLNSFFVLAMLPMVECGVGLNFALPLGILCGQPVSYTHLDVYKRQSHGK